MQTQPRDCACHYQSLLGYPGPTCPIPALPKSACQTPGLALPSPTASPVFFLTPSAFVPRAPKCLLLPRVLTLKSIINAAVPQFEPARASAAPPCQQLPASPHNRISPTHPFLILYPLPQLPMELGGCKPQKGHAPIKVILPTAAAWLCEEMEDLPQGLCGRVGVSCHPT